MGGRVWVECGEGKKDDDGKGVNLSRGRPKKICISHQSRLGDPSGPVYYFGGGRPVGQNNNRRVVNMKGNPVINYGKNRVSLPTLW